MDARAGRSKQQRRLASAIGGLEGSSRQGAAAALEQVVPGRVSEAAALPELVVETEVAKLARHEPQLDDMAGVEIYVVGRRQMLLIMTRERREEVMASQRRIWSKISLGSWFHPCSRPLEAMAHDGAEPIAIREVYQGGEARCWKRQA